VVVLLVLPVSAARAATRDQGGRQCDRAQTQAAVKESFHRNVLFFPKRNNGSRCSAVDRIGRGISRPSWSTDPVRHPLTHWLTRSVES
jgi:hypothetical protein